MADRRTVVTLSVADDFSRNLQNFARQMAASEKGVQNLSRAAQSGGGMKEFNSQLFFMAQNAGMVYGAFQRVFSTASQWAQIGIGAERANTALERLVGSTKIAQQQIEAIQRGARGTLTGGEAAQLGYQLQRFNLADTADEMERFVKTVSTVAAVNPALGGTAEAINQIQLTLSNMSFMRLDQLGISAGQVRERMAELKKEFAGLSDEDAFRTAVLEQLDEQATILGDDFMQLGTSTEQLKTKLRELKEVVGVEIAQGFDGAATAVMGFIEIIKYFENNPITIDFEMIGLPGEIGGITPTALLEAAILGPGGYAVKELLQTAGERGRTGLTGAPIVPAGMYGGGSLTGVRPWWEMAQEASAPAWFGVQGDWGSRYRPPSTVMNPYAAGPAMAAQPYTYYGDQATLTDQARAASTPPSRMERLGIPYVAGQQIGGFLGGSLGSGAEQAGQLLSGVTSIAGDLASVLGVGADNVGRMAAEAEQAAVPFQSLAEKFGTDQAKAFDVDVYGEMTAAMQDAGASAEDTAAAVERYQLQTGMATASSELFAGGMESLAQQLTAGEISANEYADAVLALGQMDYSWADRMIQPLIDDGDIGRAQQYLDIMNQMQTQSWTAPGLQTPELGMGAEMGTGAGGELVGYAATAGGEIRNPMQEMVDTAALANDKVTQLEAQLEALHGTSYSLSINLDVIAPASITIPIIPGTPTDVQEVFAPGYIAPIGMPATQTVGTGDRVGPARPGGAREFAEGGFSGPGGPAVLHPNELILPEQIWQRLFSQPRGDYGGGAGRSSAPVVIENRIYLDSREIDSASRKHQRLRNNQEGG